MTAARRVAGLFAVLSGALYLVTLAFQLTRRGRVFPELGLAPERDVLAPVLLLGAVVGVLIASRTPSKRVGWILIWMGFAGLSGEVVREYAIYALLHAPGSLPLGPEAAWLSSWAWVPTVAAVAALLLYFPDGKLPSRRWRAALWLDGAFVVSTLVHAGLTWRHRGLPLLQQAVDPAFPTTAPATAFEALGKALLASVLAVSAWSVVQRYRRAGGIERHQLKWLTYAAVIFAFAILTAYYVFGGEYGLINLVSHLAVGALFVSVGIAVFKYRLYQIDVVISKTIVYGTLAGFITAIYVGIVVGIGTLFGAGDEPNLALSIVATALIAVAFQPVKKRVQKLANRLVYGHRSTPYEVLAEFSGKMAGSYAQDELLSQIAAALGDASGAASSHVWVKVGDQMRLAGSYHRASGEEHLRHHAPVPVIGTSFDIPHSDRVVPVLHKDELLGALAITKPPGEPVTPVEDKLMRDLAAQAGVVLSNVRLTEELLLRLEELKASRQRLIAAQDKARRRLERDLHDGAQQQLVALKVKLSLAQRLTTQEKVKTFLTQLQSEADEALQTLRDLARGIYPPLLAEKGLPAALVAQANKAPMEVDVRADGVGRYAQEVEAAVYFCCLEALQNVAKYAGDCKVEINLISSAGVLTFEVVDDGCGFELDGSRRGRGLQNMSDRVDALGGDLTVTSTPGVGTAVRGRIPARQLETAAAGRS